VLRVEQFGAGYGGVSVHLVV